MTTKEKPILFSGPMIKAILAGTKTQTRRIVKPQPDDAKDPNAKTALVACLRFFQDNKEHRCPYGQPGDRLWVKEDFSFLSLPYRGNNRATIQYAADGERRLVTLTDREVELFCARKFPHRKTLARFMYRSCSRLNPIITAVRVERLQDISEADALAEGIRWPDISVVKMVPETPVTFVSPPVRSYGYLWESINGPGSWARNPWVWVIEFKRL